MKNNIILILVVTVISIAVIIISVAVSAGKSSEESSAPSGDSKPSVTTQNTTQQSVESSSAPEENNVHSAPATEESTEPDRVTDPQTAENIISLARTLIGTDFVDGGASPVEGFDNSGFIYFVLRENGYITCPRGVSAQAEMGAALVYSELQPGDLVFFSESGTAAEFGGIYAGNGVMIACLMPGTQVKEVNITTDYYTKNFFRGVAIS
ncbi:MAG: C40 family peptidase [Oscillospiraceae bacterium]